MMKTSAANRDTGMARGGMGAVIPCAGKIFSRGNTMTTPRFVPASLRKPHWFLLGREAAVKRAPGSLHRQTLLGNPLVSFQTAGGELAVMDDACPHRGASLARGEVRDSCVVCPGHGMAFGPATSPARAYDYAALQGPKTCTPCWPGCRPP